MRALSRHITKAPSPTTLVLFAIFTGPNVPAPLPHAALSLSTRLYGGPWTMWKDAADDESNTAWHRECVRLMKPYSTGYYIGETDPVAVSSEATGAFSPESWKRLADLRDKLTRSRKRIRGAGVRPQRRVKVDSAVRPLYTEDLLQILAREQLDQTALIVARSRVGHLYKSKLSARELSRTPEL